MTATTMERCSSTRCYPLAIESPDMDVKIKIVESLKEFARRYPRRPTRLRLSLDAAFELWGLTEEDLGSLADFAKLSVGGPKYLEDVGLFGGDSHLPVTIVDEFPEGLDVVVV